MSTKSTKKDSPLSKVQNLYLMQVELWNFLDNTESDAEQCKSAQKTLKEFSALLEEVDWRIMGGEDILETMHTIPSEVKSKLKKAPKKTVAAKKTAKKPTAKKTVKKKATKKKK